MPSVRRIDPRIRLLFCVLVTIVVLVAGCGGDDGEAAGEPVSTSCADRLVDLANAEATVADAADGELSPETGEAFDALDEDCDAEFETMSDADVDAIVARMDPAVAAVIGRAAATEFEKTGDAIN